MVVPAPGNAESLRLRSVRQYAFARDRGDSPPLVISSTKTISHDTALTAFCQLVTWRLNVQRSIVSLVDRDNQYFLAESTSTLNLADTSEPDENGGTLWMGCTGSTRREHALCANTIKAPLPMGKQYALFCVPDLSENAAYSQLPYVAGPPYFKFYAGTPLTTRDGARIGSLFVIDDRPREGLNDGEQSFLGIMAQTVMDHLDMQRDMEQQERSTAMSKGLAAFIEGLERIPPSWGTRNNSTVEETVVPLQTRKSRGVSDVGSTMHESNTSPEGSTAASYQTPKHITTHSEVLSRASSLMRQSLDVNYTVFLDASLAIATDPAVSNKSALQNGSHSSMVSTEDKDPDLEPIQSQREAKKEHHLAAVLSYSTEGNISSGSESESPSMPFRCTEHRFVQYLLRKYPSGVLWSFDENGNLAQTEGAALDFENDKPSDDHFYESAADPENNERSRESASLIYSFPGARQILFAPIFDSATSNYICASFAVSLKEIPVFSTEIEVSFVRGFLNSVAAEYDRVSTKIADRQKGDFISSVSHEFRTPLHGILASTSLLLDSELDNLQRNLCETIDSCGRTLFNTVSHVLDYTKLNNFNRRLNNPSKDQSGGANVSSLHIYSTVDVAKICEDAVHVVYEGYIHDQKVSDVQHTTIKNVSLEIEPGNWHFSCTPGAIQRIIMNLFGNSLKYTKSGNISCKIERHCGDASEDMSIVRIVVEDTGIGISDEFLRYKLYKPFHQESTLSEGTGLGLSIVEKIVRSLDGTVEIKSRLEQGTSVTVELPLTRMNEAMETPSSVSLLQSRSNGETVAFYGFEENDNKTSLGRSLQNYTTKWFDMKFVDNLLEADFIIFDEEIPDDVLETIAARAVAPRALIAGCDVSRAVDFGKHPVIPIYTLTKPIGPNTFARAFLAALGQSDDSGSQRSPEEAGSHIPEGEQPDFSIEAPKLIPDLDRPTDLTDFETVHHTAEQPMIPIRNSKVQEAPVTPPTATEVQRKDCQNSLRSPRILCVDDNAINLKLLQAYLRKLKYTNVKYAVDGLEAYKVVSDCTEPFDIIFMDLSMPICDGFESTQKIRACELQKFPSQPPSNIIALTGLAADRDQSKAYACGMDCYVTKPLSLSHLKTMMEDWQAVGKIERHSKT